MRRRELIVLLAGAAVLPRSAYAQQNSAMPKVGILFPGALGPEREKWIRAGLVAELGSDSVALIDRSAQGDSQRLGSFAAELAQMRVDVILAAASGALQAARQASRTIPIVALDLETDPVASGAVESLSRPGGNVTGIFFDAPEIAGKWVQILKEVLPRLHSVALLFDAHLDETQVRAGESTARTLGVATLRLGIDRAGELRGAFKRAVEAKVDAVLVHSSPVFTDEARAIAELAREFKLPSVGLFPIYAKVGGLISYGPDNFELLKQAGGIAGRILRGAKPAEFPIQRPIHFQFLINMSTAQSLQLTIPASLVALADEVIE